MDGFTGCPSCGCVLSFWDRPDRFECFACGYRQPKPHPQAAIAGRPVIAKMGACPSRPVEPPLDPHNRPDTRCPAVIVGGHCPLAVVIAVEPEKVAA